MILTLVHHPVRKKSEVVTIFPDMLCCIRPKGDSMTEAPNIWMQLATKTISSGKTSETTGACCCIQAVITQHLSEKLEDEREPD